MLVRTVTNDRPRKRSRASARASRAAKIPRKVSLYKPSLHRFTRKCAAEFYLNNTSGWNATDISLQAYFTLAGTQFFLGATTSVLAAMGSGDFTALFDEYRIDWVNCQILYGDNSSSLGGTIQFPALHVTNDYNDVDASTIAKQLETQNCKSVILGRDSNAKGLNFFIKPKAQVQTYRTAITTGYAPKGNMWISTAQNNVPHYGMKWVYESLLQNNTAIGVCKFIFTYGISCRDVI